MRLWDILQETRKAFRAANLETPELDAELLLAAALGLERHVLFTSPDMVVEGESLARFKAMVERRLNHEPVSRILGKREFWSMDFTITPDTLDPRPDSEAIVEALLSSIDKTPVGRSGPWKLLDLGTGSGCLLLVALSELPQAQGVGLDQSEAALQVARENASAHNLEERSRFIKGDWTSEPLPKGPFDYILANPPYISQRDFEQLTPEVRCFDPESALLASEKGLYHYKCLAPQVLPALNPGGYVFFEVGDGQSISVAQILEKAGFLDIEMHPDLSDVERVVSARKGA